ncbi:MAG: M28 family peptidase [Chloroflexota bacterium]|nr:M28 family peptidase [Chloroflexota bacterium]
MAAIPVEEKAGDYLNRLCLEIPGRRVGSEGNRTATEFFAEKVQSFGFETKTPPFPCIDWLEQGADLFAGDSRFDVLVSPYSLGASVEAPLVSITTVDEMRAADVAGKILLLRGDIAKEQLMPKKFPFFNPERHQEIIQLLETGNPVAIAAATTQDPGLAGAVSPFPLIEDGDFDIPSVYMTAKAGDRLAQLKGEQVSLEIRAARSPARGRNVVATKGTERDRRVVIFAHIDAKDGTPGAIDNSTGVVILLLLAELLAGYKGSLGVEIVALNGEDYYSAPGEKLWLARNSGTFHQIHLGINLDGVGYREGKTAYSLYDCSPELARYIHDSFAGFDSIAEGDKWYQSDHSLFLLKQRPALALTSDHFDALWREIAHTADDVPDIVDSGKLVDAAFALLDLILRLERYRP